MNLSSKLKPIPLGLSGLALGTIGLTAAFNSMFKVFETTTNKNILLYFSLIIQSVVVALVLIYLIIMLIRFIVNRKQLHEEISTPNLSGFIPTYFMASACVVNYVAWILNNFVNDPKLLQYLLIVPSIVMLFLLACQFACLGFFLIKVFKKHSFSADEAFASWFVPTVGMGLECGFVGNFVSVVPLVVFQIVWIIGLVFYVIFMPIVLYKFLFKPHKEQTNIYSMAVFAAPPNLLSVGFLSTFNPNAKYANVLSNVTFYNHMMLFLLMVVFLGFGLFIAILVKAIMMKKFNYGWASFTFPASIMANSLFQYSITPNLIAFKNGMLILSFFAITLATVIVLYVNIRYWTRIKHYCNKYLKDK